VARSRQSARRAGHGRAVRTRGRPGEPARACELVRWYRSGEYLWNGRTLSWEYTRETPEGDQIDIAEFMGIHGGLIHSHRIYWGWFGFMEIVGNAVAKAANATEDA
jgi:hypothetical protein